MICNGTGHGLVRSYRGQHVCRECGKSVKTWQGRAVEHRDGPEPYDPTGRNQTVYFISDDSGHIKIGTASDVAIRMRSMQTANATKLRIEATCPGGEPLERDLHQKFAGDRLCGEWFVFTETIAELIDDLNLQVVAG
jgi:T5orf172 domain